MSSFRREKVSGSETSYFGLCSTGMVAVGQTCLYCTAKLTYHGLTKRSTSLLARGAGHVRYKGHPGAVMHLGMTTMAHNGAVVVRIRQQRLSKRAQKFRRLLGLRQRKINGINDQKN